MSSFLITRSTDEQFENDYKLKHIVISIKYWDIEIKQFINAELDLFGHCLKLTTLLYNKLYSFPKLVKAILDESIPVTLAQKAQLKLAISQMKFKGFTNREHDIANSERWTWLKALMDSEGYPPYAAKRVIKRISNPDNELEYRATLVEGSNNYHVVLDNYGGMTFWMPGEKLELLKNHYHEMNKPLPALRESFKNNVNSKVSLLLDDSDLVEMGKRFVDELPIRFYTDIHYLMMVEYLIEETYSHLGKLILMSTKEQRLVFLEERSDFFNENSNEVAYYLHDKLAMFTRIIKEKTTISDSRQDFFITYAFIYNIVIEHFAHKWENEHKQYFKDIGILDIDQAIERYCSIETNVHSNEISAGIFIYYLIKHRKFEQDNRNYLSCREIFIPKLNKLMENRKYNNFVNRLKKPSTSSQIKYSINDVDLMNGQEFEIFIAELFSKLGYESEITKASGDQGIDVIASKNGNKIGIQAKCYSSTVGNSAIQEAVAGKSHYRLDKAIVVTNNFFTDAAQQLAQSNSIILWDRNILKEKIDEIFNSSLN